MVAFSREEDASKQKPKRFSIIRNQSALRRPRGHSRSKSGIASLAHSRSKNGVASLGSAHPSSLKLMDCRVKPGNDG
jgi:hypothetical protein